MGDHVNGPSKITIDAQANAWLQEPDFIAQKDGQTVNLSELLCLSEDKFLGQGYSARYPHAGTGLAFLFKVLSVNTALSI